jgi:ornithine carbamoyltransferase
MKNFICMNDCSTKELSDLLNLSTELKNAYKKGMPKFLLKGQVLAMVFEKASLRTRISFEVAMYDLGGTGLYLKPEDIGIMGEREPVKDMARVFGRYVNGIMARTFSHDTIHQLAKYAGVPVINALSDWSHPCQAMADMLTIKEHLGNLAGKKLTFIGDGNNVARSLAFACSKFDMKMNIASPEGYTLDQETVDLANKNSDCVRLYDNAVEAVHGAHVIYTDTWVSMGQEDTQKKRINDFKGFQVNQELMAYAPDAKVMHCLPAHRGCEITDQVAESVNSVIFDQAENRLHFQRALLADLLG